MSFCRVIKLSLSVPVSSISLNGLLLLIQTVKNFCKNKHGFQNNGMCKKYFFFISDLAVSESIISVISVIRESRLSFTKIFYCKHDCDNLPIPCRSKSALVDFGLKFESLCAFCLLKYMLCVFTPLKKLFRQR